MNKPLLCSLALLFCSLQTPSSLGCINNYVTNHANVAKSRSLVAELQEVSLIESWETRATRLQAEMAKGAPYTVQNDLAVALMHLGRAGEAIPILQKIEETNPGLYRTATNLGTAYELTGDPVRALEWIRRGIERNPLSHEGSEWIHVRILETKINHAHEPEWCPSASILGLDFGDGRGIKMPSELPPGNDGAPLTLGAVQAGLKIQLHERLQFIKGNDAIMASLLGDYADCVAATVGTPGVSTELYALAMRFLPNGQHDLFFSLMVRADMAHRANQSPKYGQNFLSELMDGNLSRLSLVGVAGLLGALGIVLVRRRSLREAQAKMAGVRRVR